MSIVDLPVTVKIKEEKFKLLRTLHLSIVDLQNFIVKNSVDVMDDLDLTFIESDKNTLEVLFETIRRK